MNLFLIIVLLKLYVLVHGLKGLCGQHARYSSYSADAVNSLWSGTLGNSPRYRGLNKDPLRHSSNRLSGVSGKGFSFRAKNCSSHSAQPAVTNDDDDDSKLWLEWLESGNRMTTGRAEKINKKLLKSKRTPKILTRESINIEVSRNEKYSANDWSHNIASLPNSTILREISSPLIFMSSWATFVSIVHRFLLSRRPLLAEHLAIPAAPHSLLVSAIGLLLVFRTNSAYQRFVEGRKIWEVISSTARDITRMLKLYEQQIGKDKRVRVQRLLAAFPYLLRHRIRPNLLMRKLKDTNFERNEYSLLLYDDAAMTDYDLELATAASDEENDGKSRRNTRPLYWVDRRTLPWRLLPKGALETCARAQNRPLWVVDRMSKEIQTVPDQHNWTSRERLTILGMLNKMSSQIGKCERIHQTIVPSNYARHSLRSLTIWLLGLPLALVKDLGLATGPAVWVIAWCLFGVYQIGYSIEDPFQGTLRLSILCDSIRRDVIGDEFFRDTAFEEAEELQEEINAVNGVVNTAKANSQVYDTGFLDGENEDEQVEHVASTKSKSN